MVSPLIDPGIADEQQMSSVDRQEILGEGVTKNKCFTKINNSLLFWVKSYQKINSISKSWYVPINFINRNLLVFRWTGAGSSPPSSINELS